MPGKVTKNPIPRLELAYEMRRTAHTWDSIAAALGVTVRTLIRWRRRYAAVAERLEKEAEEHCEVYLGELASLAIASHFKHVAAGKQHPNERLISKAASRRFARFGEERQEAERSGIDKELVGDLVDAIRDKKD